jgi:hypothetical protein
MAQSRGAVALILLTVINCFVLATSMPYLHPVIHRVELAVVDVVDRMDSLVVLSKMP